MKFVNVILALILAALVVGLIMGTTTAGTPGPVGNVKADGGSSVKSGGNISWSSIVALPPLAIKPSPTVPGPRR